MQKIPRPPDVGAHIKQKRCPTIGQAPVFIVERILELETACEQVCKVYILRSLSSERCILRD